MGKILIVAGDESFLRRAEDFLKVCEEDIEILTALNGRQALQILNTSTLDLIVTDLEIPGEDGFDFLAHISSNHQTLTVMVLIELATPAIQERLDQIGHFHCLKKTVPLEVLGEQILRVLKESSKTYVQGFSLANFVQFVKIEQKTCTVMVRSKNKVGYLYFDKGEFINAETNDVEGEDAATIILSWNYTETEIQGICNKERKIFTPLMQILLEAAQLKDENVSLPSADDLLDEAIKLAEGYHFQQAKKKLALLLKICSRNHKGWLWFSRIADQKKSIELSLNNAIKIAPEDLEVKEEIQKFNLAKNKIGDKRFLRCPFCWSPFEGGSFQCLYCDGYLFIREQSIKKTSDSNRKVMNEAVRRYEKVIQREKNIKAYYYLSMAHLNLKNWEEALSHLDMAVKLAPTRQFYFDQLRILLKHMASTGAFSTQDLLSQEKSLNSVTESLRGVQRKKVLVVEDSTTTRKVISITLRQNGFETIEAGDGLEALSKLNEVKPDLILLDIILPKMDGYKTLSILKRSDDFKHIPVIMLTSRDKLLDRIKGKMSGSEEYLTKPFNPDELVAKVNKYLPGR